MGILDFGADIEVKSINAPIDMTEFGAFEKAFHPFVERKDEILGAIPGSETWPAFVPPREKILEYYLTVKALALNESSVYVDIASCLSLFPNYLAEIVGCTVVRQDMFYAPGVHFVEHPRVAPSGSSRVRIPVMGSDGCSLPLASGSVDAMALHCSFEHFEGDADGRFVTEALRVLKSGGRLLIIPFYCGYEYQEILKDNFAVGCQFQRYYTPAKFVERVLAPHTDAVTVEMRYYDNVKEADESFYCYYSVALFKK